MCRLLLNSPPDWKFSCIRELEKRSKACHSIDIFEYSCNTIKWKFKSLHNCQKYELSFLYIIFPEKFRKTLRLYCFSMRSLRIGISRNSKSKFTLLNGKFPYLLADFFFCFSIWFWLFLHRFVAVGISLPFIYFLHSASWLRKPSVKPSKGAVGVGEEGELIYFNHVWWRGGGA